MNNSRYRGPADKSEHGSPAPMPEATTYDPARLAALAARLQGASTEDVDACLHHFDAPPPGQATPPSAPEGSGHDTTTGWHDVPHDELPWNRPTPYPDGEDLELEDGRQVVDEEALDPGEVTRVTQWLRRLLNRRLGRQTLDADTVDVALRLGDLLAVSGNALEALTVYREILERLLDGRLSGADRVAERVGAVISRTGLEGSRRPIVADLTSMLPRFLDDPNASRQLYDTMLATARRDLADLSLLQQGMDGLRRATARDLSHEATAELDATAMRNSAAALVRLGEVSRVGDPRNLIGTLGDAVLDTGLRSARVVAGYRGHEHPVRFADHFIVTSPLPDGATHAQHIAAVLATPLESRSGVTLRDVFSAIGAFAEDSAALLREWRERIGLTECDVVINCPRLLRNRPAPENFSILGDPAAPHLASLVMTSLAWAGAADIGAILADDWGWGYAAANDAQRLVAFGDWTENPADSYRQADDARWLLRTTNTLLDALPDLPRRVCVLDEPRGAIEALASRSSIGSAEQPVAIVAVLMSPRRMKWVAQHMLSHGGENPPSAQQVQQRTAALAATQHQLREVVEGCRSDATPVLVVEMDDHLHDGYAEQTGTDPVDEDFDCFYSTAQKVRAHLEQLTAGPAAMIPAGHR